ncbi:MAG TPA: anti-sigma factor [Gemmatimonadaceae bacterium]|nr:anti-sigma factor [Gemmatimonadaceae bacterium]
MKQLTHEQLLELLPAYALGALDAEEKAAIDSALRSGSPEGAELQRELRVFEEVATKMASANPVVPSAGVKERLLSRVAATKHVNLAATPQRSRSRSWLITALAASLVLAAGLGRYAFRLREALLQREATLTATAARLVQREGTLNPILEAEGSLRVARLSGPDTSGAGLTLFWNEKQHRGVVHAFRLRPAPQGRSYQLWLIKDGKPVSVSVFNSDPDGHALVQNLALPESATGTSLVALTEEPAGGSPGPTTTPFLTGPLAK